MSGLSSTASGNRLTVCCFRGSRDTRGAIDITDPYIVRSLAEMCVTMMRRESQAGSRASPSNTGLAWLRHGRSQGVGYVGQPQEAREGWLIGISKGPETSPRVAHSCHQSTNALPRKHPKVVPQPSGCRLHYETGSSGGWEAGKTAVYEPRREGAAPRPHLQEEIPLETGPNVLVPPTNKLAR